MTSTDTPSWPHQAWRKRVFYDPNTPSKEEVARSNKYRLVTLRAYGRKQNEVKTQLEAMKVRVESSKKYASKNIQLRAEVKKLRSSKKEAKQNKSPTSVADGIVKMGKDTMPGLHKQTRARAILDNLEAAYGDEGKAALMIDATNAFASVTT